MNVCVEVKCRSAREAVRKARSLQKQMDALGVKSNVVDCAEEVDGKTQYCVTITIWKQPGVSFFIDG